MILGYLWRAPVMLAGQALAYPLVPVAVQFCDDLGNLPWPFRWLETHDNPGWKGPASEPATAAILNKGQLRWAMCRWLWRNKAYRLAGWLGMKGRQGECTLRSGGPLVPPVWGPSLWWATLHQDGRTWWELQPRISLGRVVLYLRVGWKILGYATAAPGAWPGADRQDGMFNAISLRMKSTAGWG